MTIAGSLERSFKKLADHPDVALIPFVFDLLALGLVVGLVLMLGAEPNLTPGELIRPNFPADVPEALPTVKYVGDPVGILYDTAPAHLAGIAVALLATVPLRAYGSAGFVGVLYHRVHKDLGPRAKPFVHYAKRFYGPMFVLELVFALLFLPGLFVYLLSPTWAVAYASGAMLLYVLLLFAPYAVVADGASIREAIQRSVRMVAGNVRTCVPMILIALVLTGVFALVAQAMIGAWGLLGYLGAGLLFSPIGTVLSLFFLSVYTRLRGSPYVQHANVAYIG